MEHIDLDDLSAYIDGALPPARQSQVNEHIAACGACRAEYESLAWATSFARAMPRAPLPRSASLGIPVPETSAPHTRWHLPRAVPAFATLAAVLVVAVTVTAALQGRSPAPGVPAASQVALEEVEAEAEAEAEAEVKVEAAAVATVGPAVPSPAPQPALQSDREPIAPGPPAGSTAGEGPGEAPGAEAAADGRLDDAATGMVTDGASAAEPGPMKATGSEPPQPPQPPRLARPGPPWAAVALLAIVVAVLAGWTIMHRRADR